MATNDGKIPRGTIRLVRGDDRTIVRGPAKQDGVAVDLTGHTIWLTMRERGSDAGGLILLRKTGGQGITLQTQSGATLGCYEIEFPKSLTATLTPTPSQRGHEYDIQIMTPGGKVSTAEMGDGFVERDITLGEP